jgi:hypothetical protein
MTPDSSAIKQRMHSTGACTLCHVHYARSTYADANKVLAAHQAKPTEAQTTHKHTTPRDAAAALDTLCFRFSELLQRKRLLVLA